MTYDELGALLIARWNESGRISAMGRAIVLSSREIQLLVAACQEADERRSQSHPSQTPRSEAQ